MAMGTTEHSNPNPQMGAAPMQPHATPANPATPPGVDAHGRGPTRREYGPGEPVPPPGWGSAQDTSKPFLSERDEEVDWVMLLRCYPNARSKDELRALALAAGEEALRQAAEATASIEQPVPQYDDQGNIIPPEPRPGQPDTRQPPPPPAPPQPSREAHGKDEHEHDKKK